MSQLLNILPSIQSVTVHCHTLWILGEYATSVAEIEAIVSSIRNMLGEIPIVEDEIMKTSSGDRNEPEPEIRPQVSQKVTADGTYATQSAFSSVVLVLIY